MAGYPYLVDAHSLFSSSKQHSSLGPRIQNVPGESALLCLFNFASSPATTLIVPSLFTASTASPPQGNLKRVSQKIPTKGLSNSTAVLYRTGPRNLNHCRHIFGPGTASPRSTIICSTRQRTHRRRCRVGKIRACATVRHCDQTAY